jgi:short subunit dehydrogenase-like uncharacterized protein
MADVVLFGATGYTGRLTAEALHRRDADFAIAGRNRGRLEELADSTGHPQVHVADVGDETALASACEGAKVLITCVGPFVELGQTAVEAALRAKVHYIDSTGEGVFIQALIDDYSQRARDAGIALAPAMAFDEVPADVAATLATQDLSSPELVLTYAVPSLASKGTLRSALGILVAPAPWIEKGQTVNVRAGQHERWAPMPPPLGPRSSVAAPLAELRLAPLHLRLSSLKTFMTTGGPQRIGLRVGLPFLKAALSTETTRRLTEEVLTRAIPSPDPAKGSSLKWTILAEARSADGWRNVAVMGTDPYGLSAELLAASAMAIASSGPQETGVISPVQAIGVDVLQKELIGAGVSIDTYEPV